MPKANRVEKLNMLLCETLGTVIDREVEFPPDFFVTITHVITSRDLRYSTVFISVLNQHHGKALEILSKHIYDIQQQLNRMLRMRPVPKIRFAIDEQELRREAVEKSLATVKQRGEI